MLPSELLRKEISKKYNIDLEEYAWSKELQEEIFSIELDEYLEENAKTLDEIYNEGFNIGHCGLTSRYIARKFPEAKLIYGKCLILVGTEKAEKGEHAWTIINDYIVDSTLMISFPQDKAEKMGYIVEKEIANESARMLSEYDLYDHEYKKIKSK